MNNTSNNEPEPASHHYSGRNRVPNVKEFMASLDSDKKARDAKIDSNSKNNNQVGEAKQHHNEPRSAKNARTVRDPVTGKDVKIQDADISFEEAVDNPQVRKLHPWYHDYSTVCRHQRRSIGKGPPLKRH